MENLEKSLLISLIVVLGVILYFKLLRTLQRRRLNNSYSAILGYDILEESLVIKYELSSDVSSSFVLKSSEGDELRTIDLVENSPGVHEVSTPTAGLNGEIIFLHFTTNNQTIKKKIYLNPES